ncbi:MAG: glycoside hydrolase family 127 protein [Clostridia bacterium]|nr:glycoside hydrolase family 127 protein [Clostridia bacterium]
MTSYFDLFEHANAKDAYIPAKPSEVKFSGMLDNAIKSVIDGLFLKLDTDALVSWFKERTDPFAAGEFFGKILRAAANFCAYSKDVRLKDMIDGMVRKILATKDSDGCISTVKRENQPNGSNGSDLWERKYVLLGLFEYFENFGPTLDTEDDVLDAMTALAEFTANQIGDGEGKTNITETGWAFCGIESSSILEPVMKLYLVSGNARLFQFAEYIVKSGACSRENIFDAALNGKSPYKIGSNGNPKESIAKAYEMMSCFEGLLDYYRATGKKEALKAAENLIDKINDEEITLLGSGGGDAPYNLGPGRGEQWNRTRYEILNPDMDLAMETCVTVTYMKLLYKAYLITGNVSHVDRIEVSLCNALLGALSKDGSYFEYFPKFTGTRRVFDNFSYMVGDMNLSCCTANGPMGLAIIPKLAVTKSASTENEYCINIYAPLNFKSEKVSFSIETRYPENGDIKLTINNAPSEGFALLFRIPEFAEDYRIKLNGKELKTCKASYGYCKVPAKLNKGDCIELSMSYGIKLHKSLESINPLTPIKGLYTYGPCVMTLDGSVCGDGIGGFRIKKETQVSDFGKGGSDLKTEPFRITINEKEFIPYFAAGRLGDKENEFVSWFDFE